MTPKIVHQSSRTKEQKFWGKQKSIATQARIECEFVSPHSDSHRLQTPEQDIDSVIWLTLDEITVECNLPFDDH